MAPPYLCQTFEVSKTSSSATEQVPATGESTSRAEKSFRCSSSLLRMDSATTSMSRSTMQRDGRQSAEASMRAYPRERFSSAVSLTPSTVVAFANAAGDDNPIHHDPDFAANTRFG